MSTKRAPLFDTNPTCVVVSIVAPMKAVNEFIIIATEARLSV